MRRLLVPSLLAIVAAVPALAEDVVSQATVAAATVYPHGAELTHRANVELAAGSHRVFLPYTGLDDISALPRIRTSEGVSIGTLGFRRDMTLDREALFTEAQAAAFARVEALEDEVAAQEDEIATARADVKALEAQLDFLTAVKPGEEMSAEDVLAMAGTLRSETAASHTALVAARVALRPLQEVRDELTEDLAEAERAFARLSPPNEMSDMLIVEVAVAEAGPVALELTELTHAASWEMDYDLDLDRDAGSLAIERKLVVTQYTGRTWDGVALTLSTARPGEEVGPSPVNPDRARIFEAIAYARSSAAPAPMADEAEMGMLAEPMLEADMKSAELMVDGLAVSYVYPDAVTIGTDEAAELALDTLSFDAEPGIHAAPRWDDTAFTVATFSNNAGEPVLPGWANIQRDGHFVGREYIEMIPAGAETLLPFGPIDSIRLDTVFERNAEGDTGIITRSSTREQLITFTVENLTGEAQEVRALFPLTFSEQEDLEVEVTATPAPDETDLEKQRGVSAWDLSLAPGETAEVSIRVELDWPEGMELGWNP